MKQEPVEELAQVLECFHTYGASTSMHEKRSILFAWWHLVVVLAISLFQSGTPSKEMGTLAMPQGTIGDLSPHFSPR